MPLISLPKFGTKFLEEKPGVLSMARLAAFLQTIAGFSVQMGAIFVAVKGNEHSAGIIAALSAGSAACFAGAWAALKERHKPSDDVQPPAPGMASVSVESQGGGAQKTVVTAQPAEPTGGNGT